MFLLAITLACVAGAPLWASAVTPRTERKEPAMALRLTSPAFRHHGRIPAKHTCDGADVSPPLAWAGAPPGTRSFTIIVDDPDAPDPAAPRMDWVHWVLYDLPPGTTSLAAGTTAKALPPGTREGLNDWRRPGWRGPCPPIGRHRYFHRLYALDMVLPDLHHPTRAALEKAMAGHVLAKAELVGTYQRTR